MMFMGVVIKAPDLKRALESLRRASRRDADQELSFYMERAKGGSEHAVDLFFYKVLNDHLLIDVAIKDQPGSLNVGNGRGWNLSHELARHGPINAVKTLLVEALKSPNVYKHALASETLSATSTTAFGLAMERFQKEGIDTRQYDQLAKVLGLKK